MPITERGGWGRISRYDVWLSRRAKRDLNNVPDRDYHHLDCAIDQLADNPRPSGVTKLYGTVYRIRVGDWRIIYNIDDVGSVVLIEAVRRRNEGTYRR